MGHISLHSLARRLRQPVMFVLVLLAVEWLDEFAFGAREAAWPLVRSDLKLSYEQIGVLLSLPAVIGYFIEPLIGILGDVWQRRILIVGGGVLFTFALALTATSHDFLLLLISFIVFSPSSGAFVGLSQSSLMDIDPVRHEQNMARWTFAGSVGVVSGALFLGAMVALGSNWRQFYALAALMSLFIVLIVCHFSFSPAATTTDDEDSEPGLIEGIRVGLQAIRRPQVLRWLVLLEFSDLMLDVLYGYLALYFVDVVGVSETQAGIAVAVWTGIGLVGSLAMIVLLERMRGLRYLQISAWLELGLFAMFLLVPGFIPKLLILTLIGLCNAGWYSVLKGQLYSVMSGQSGTVMAVSSLTGFVGSAIPFCVGLAADRFGLNVGIALLIIGPIALLVGLPRRIR